MRARRPRNHRGRSGDAPGAAPDADGMPGAVLAGETGDLRSAGERALPPGLSVREGDVVRVLGLGVVGGAAGADDDPLPVAESENPAQST